MNTQRFFGLMLTLGMMLMATVGRWQVQAAGEPCTNCAPNNGSMAATNDSKFHPNGAYYEAKTAGYHKGWLRGPANTNFNLYLQRWDGAKWVYVASSTNNGSEEAISFYGTPGFYTWQVYSFNGGGAYTLWLQFASTTPTPTPTPAANFTLTATPTSVAAGGQVKVNFTAPSGRPENDWVGLYKVGELSTSYLAWGPTKGYTASYFNFTMPNQPGQYEFRYFLGNSYTQVARSNAVQVTSNGTTTRTNRAPSLTRVLISRAALSNGRTDSVRPTSAANPLGLSAVPGFGNPTTGAAGLLTTIAAQANPKRITLDRDGNGLVDGIDVNPVVLASAGLPSCFTLAVAEGLSDPDGDPVGARWTHLAERFGSGNLYATVSIPTANITAGMELVTYDQLNAYTANSIIYEAPDYGLSPASLDATSGAVALQAQAIDMPPAPLTPLLSGPQLAQVEYARSVQVDLKVVSICKLNDGRMRLRLQADLSRSFDPLNNTWFRWAYQSNNLTLVRDIPASTQVEFLLPKEQEGASAYIWVAASSKGPQAGANPNPFVQQPPEQVVGNLTFVTVGSAVASKESITLRDQGCREICGDGLDNDGDGQIDEDCNYKLYVSDDKCKDDTIGVRVDGQELGQTPTGQGRFFDLSRISYGEHTLIITGVASAGQVFGCSPEAIVSYGLNLTGGAKILRKNGATFEQISDSGEIPVGTQVKYTIFIP
jgi:hypothetical protein